MEFTKSQFVLRSMDMDGRSLGTERPSTFQGGATQATAQIQGSSAASAGAERFAELLATRTRYGSAEVDAGVAARVGEGRTDAAANTYNSRRIQEGTWKPRESLAEGARTQESEPASGPEEQAAPGVNDDSGGEDSPLPFDEGAPDQLAQAGDLVDGGPLEVEPSEIPAQAPTQIQKPLEEGPLGTSAVRSTDGAPGAAAAAPAVTQANPNAVPSAAAAGAARGAESGPAQSTGRVAPAGRARAATQAAAPPPPAPQLPMEEARSLLDQLRVQILDGNREARLQLRPVELGRLDLTVRVEGSHVYARIAAENPEALAVLEAHAPELRSWLAREGGEEGEQTVDLQLELLDPEQDGFFEDEQRGGSGALSDRQGRARPGAREGSLRGASDPSNGGDESAQQLLGSVAQTLSETGVDFVA